MESAAADAIRGTRSNKNLPPRRGGTNHSMASVAVHAIVLRYQTTYEACRELHVSILGSLFPQGFCENCLALNCNRAYVSNG